MTYNKREEYGNEEEGYQERKRTKLYRLVGKGAFIALTPTPILAAMYLPRMTRAARKKLRERKEKKGLEKKLDEE